MSTLETDLRTLIEGAVASKLEAAGLPASAVQLEVPRQRAHGDLSTSIAMQLASRLKTAPKTLADELTASLKETIAQSPLKERVARVELKPPGFVNFFLAPAYLQQQLGEILAQGERYGRTQMGAGESVLVEFVSANPTGPLSVAHGRQAVVGDALAAVLDFAGFSVRREYYLNDEGTQIDLLGKSVLARAREIAGLPAEFPEKGYKGDYVRQIARTLADQLGTDGLQAADAEAKARKLGAERLTEQIRGELERFGVRFDAWFPQSSLEQDQYLGKTLEGLKQGGHLYEQEGAWWLRSTAFGDDKDRVVIRSDGRLTYIAADIAYHRKKFERGAARLINLWGPDHHGYIPRLKAAVQAMGFDPERLEIRLVQLCTLKRAGKVIPMSTREGEFITLTEVMDEVGVDAARFFFLLRKMDAHLEFDLELAKQHTLENPVYYIQYAHARIAGILRQGEGGSAQPDPGRLSEPETLDLLKALRDFPAVVESCAGNREPFGVIPYLQGVAEAFHRFYDRHRVVGDDPVLTATRLQLIQGVRTVIANGLKLLGVSLPARM